MTPAAEGETRDLELNLDEPIVVEAPFPWATLSSFGLSEGANIRAIGYY